MEAIAKKQTFQKYADYKDSGVEWLGEVPEHWVLNRLKNIFWESLTQNTDKKCTFYLSVLKDIGVIPFSEKGNKGNKTSLDTSNYRLVRKGDIVLNTTNVCIGSVGLSKYDGCLSSVMYIVLRPLIELDIRYYDYIFKVRGFQKYLRRISNGILEVREYLNKTLFKAELLPIPPISEQTAIAQFLDTKTAQIDTAIAQKEKLIALLQERQQIIIQNAVTKGLDPNAKMKDSGVEWIGEIPEGWELKRLRYIGQTQNGISAGAEYFGSGFPFVSYSDVYKNIELPNTVSGLANSTVDDRLTFSVKKGDVFFTRTSETVEEIGFTSTCLQTIPNGTFAGFLIRFRPRKNILDTGFSKFYFRSKIHRAFFVKEMNLVIRASLSQELLKKLPVLIPPIKEQKTIVQYIETQTSKIQQAIILQQNLITKLKEYKATLIDSAVTGKIMVNA